MLYYIKILPFFTFWGYKILVVSKNGKYSDKTIDALLAVILNVSIATSGIFFEFGISDVIVVIYFFGVCGYLFYKTNTIVEINNKSINEEVKFQNMLDAILKIVPCTITKNDAENILRAVLKYKVIGIWCYMLFEFLILFNAEYFD